MLGYIIRRILQLIPVLIGISLITFILSNVIPGDPVRIIMGQRSDRETELRIREKLGLDKPLWVQYWIWARNLVRNPGELPEFNLRTDGEKPEAYDLRFAKDTVFATGKTVHKVGTQVDGLQDNLFLTALFDLTDRTVIDGMFDDASADQTDVANLESPSKRTIVAKENRGGIRYFTFDSGDRFEMAPNALLTLGGNRAKVGDFNAGMSVDVALAVKHDTKLWALYDDASGNLPEISAAFKKHADAHIASGSVTDIVITPPEWFDFGRSYRQQREVREIIRDSFKNTAYLSTVAMLIAILVGITAGIVSAVKPHSLWDYCMMTGALIGVSMPVFWLGLMLILLFQGQLHWISSTGFGKVKWIPINLGIFMFHIPWHQNIILPAITLATVPMAIVARMTRSSMLEVLNLDYVRTARAKGLSEWNVIMKHGLKNALIPIITVIGVDFAILLAGAVLTETVFSWPGLGREIVDAIEFRDFPVVMGGVVLFAIVFVIANLVVDILYAYVDPRIRYQ